MEIISYNRMLLLIIYVCIEDNMEQINMQLDLDIGGCIASVTVNNGFINSSGVSNLNNHYHPFYEIHFIMHGNNKVKNSDGVMSVEAGDLVIIPPGLNHCFIPIANTGNHKRAAFWVELQKVELKKSGYFVFDVFNGIESIIRINGIPDTFRTVEEIQCELLRKKPCYKEILENIFSILIIQICRSLSNKSVYISDTKNDNQSLMLLIEEYIQKHYKEECTLEGLSEYVHISSRQLTRLIRQLYSKCFRQMLLEQRMSMANLLVEEDRISFDAIASEVGYGSLTAFYHAYLDYYGYTPGEYRKQCRAGSSNSEELSEESYNEDLTEGLTEELSEGS